MLGDLQFDELELPKEVCKWPLGNGEVSIQLLCPYWERLQETKRKESMHLSEVSLWYIHIGLHILISKGRVLLAISGFFMLGFWASHQWISLTIGYLFFKWIPFMLMRPKRLWEHCKVEASIYPEVKDDCKQVVQLCYLFQTKCRGRRMRKLKFLSESANSFSFVFISGGSRLLCSTVMS